MTLTSDRSVLDRDSLASLSDDELTTLIDELEARETAVRAMKLEAVAVYAEREAWRADHVPSMADWMMYRYGHGRGTAREAVRVAKALGELPAIRAVAAEGGLSWDQLRPLTKFATPEEDVSLAETAPLRTPWELERAARRIERVSTEDAVDEAERRSLKLRWDLDAGSLKLWGRLPQEEGRLVESVLHRIADTLPPNPETGERGSHRQQLADSLALMARAALASRGDRVEPAVVVHADADALLAGDGRCELECGPPIPPETARRLACDARMSMVVEEDGRTIGIGRTSRSVPPSMARVVMDRDAACRMCGGRHWLEIHHIVPFTEGGATELGNLVAVCWPCHRRVHEGGWRIDGDPAGPLIFVHPAGGTFYGEGRPRAP